MTSENRTATNILTVAWGAIFGVGFLLMMVFTVTTAVERGKPPPREATDASRLHEALHNLHPDIAFAYGSYLFRNVGPGDSAACFTVENIAIRDDASVAERQDRARLFAQCEIEKAITAATKPVFQHIERASALPAEALFAFGIIYGGAQDTLQVVGPFATLLDCFELAGAATLAGFGVQHCYVLHRGAG